MYGVSENNKCFTFNMFCATSRTAPAASLTETAAWVTGNKLGFKI